MSEGTKLGEDLGQDQFNVAVKTEEPAAETETAPATKLGEVSDLEKQIEADQATVEPASDAAPAVVEESTPAPQLTDTTFEDAVDSGDLFQDQLDQLNDYQEGDIIKGIVRSIEKSGVLVDINYKSDGFISNSEYSNNPSANPEEELNEGDEVTVFIVKLESKEGYTVLSKKRADYEKAWRTLSKLSKTKELIPVRISSKVQAGLVAEYEGIKGFIPASQLAAEKGSDMEQFVGQTLEVCVLQSDRRRRKVIFSHKQAQNAASSAESQKLLDELEVGQVREGKVTSIKDFGVFIDLGGIEGLVHISELSWSRVTHPSDIVKVGEPVSVFVLGVDRESNKVSLGMKQLQPDPWVQVAEGFEIGQVVKGNITRVTSFGAFIEIANNLEGLIHISELSYKHIEKVEDVLKVGDQVEARIIKLIPEEQKIGLSLKGIGDEEAPEQAKPDYKPRAPKKKIDSITSDSGADDLSDLARAFNVAQENQED